MMNRNFKTTTVAILVCLTFTTTAFAGIFDATGAMASGVSRADYYKQKSEHLRILNNRKKVVSMFDFDGFERREMALQANAAWEAKNISARVSAKKQPKIDMKELARLDDETRLIWAEKQAIYGGDIEIQQKAADRWLGK